MHAVLSKCLAPGYRIGWVAAGRVTRRRSSARSCPSAWPPPFRVQIALADYLRQGGG